jgi:uncharacterized membrane protein YfcA
MPVLRAFLLVLAGIGGGLAGSVAGLASIITYPALLACGLSPIAANVTNTSALVWSGVGSTLGSRPELQGQGPRLRRLLPISVVGAVGGATAVLYTSSHTFGLVVPWLILAAALVILLSRRRSPRPAEAEVLEEGPPGPVATVAVTSDPRAIPAVVLGLSIYCGYFGAAGGVLLLAVLLAATSDTLARSNAAKNVILGVANLAATVVFVLFGPLHVAEAIPLGAGCLVGSRIGPLIVRRAPAGPLRVAIAVMGIGLAAVLAYRAY